MAKLYPTHPFRGFRDWVLALTLTVAGAFSFGLTPALADLSAEEEQLVALYVVMTGAPPDGEVLREIAVLHESGMTVTEAAAGLAERHAADYRRRFPAEAPPEEIAQRLVFELYGGTRSRSAFQIEQFASRMGRRAMPDHEILQRVVSGVLQAGGNSFRFARSILENKVTASVAYGEKIARAPIETRRRVGEAVLGRVSDDAETIGRVLNYVANLEEVEATPPGQDIQGVPAEDLETWTALYVALTGLPPDGEALAEMASLIGAGVKIEDAGRRIRTLNEDAVAVQFPASLTREELGDRLLDKFIGPDAPLDYRDQLASLLRTEPYEKVAGLMANAVMRDYDPRLENARAVMKNRVDVSLAYARRIPSADAETRAGLGLLEGVGAQAESAGAALARVDALMAEADTEPQTGAAAEDWGEELRELVAVYVIMMGAPPDGETVAQMLEGLRSGSPAGVIVEEFDGDFFRARYPSFLTAEELAERLSETMLGDGVGEGSKAYTRQWIVAQVISGRSDVDIIRSAARSLLSTVNPEFDGVRSTLENRVTVSLEYAKRVERAPILERFEANVIAPVSDDPVSVDLALARVAEIPSTEFQPRQASAN